MSLIYIRSDKIDEEGWIDKTNCVKLGKELIIQIFQNNYHFEKKILDEGYIEMDSGCV